MPKSGGMDPSFRRFDVPGALPRTVTLTALASLVLAGCASAPTNLPASRVIDAAFDEAMRRYALPGLAVGVVQDDEILYVRTAGEVVAGSGQPITPDTLFKIASNSKAMTAAVLARLVDARKLHWSDAVVQHLPAFRMQDPWVTREMQVRDLLIHNSGLPSGAGDLMLWPEPNLFTRADILAALAHLKPVRSFRAQYSYDNLLYIVAGEVVAAVAGVPYEELVRREIFEPLGMSRCRVGEWRRDEVGDVAQPHMRDGQRNVVIRADEPVVPASTAAAAGGIRCSLGDMLKWVRLWLREDLTLPGSASPWLSGAQRAALWTAHMPIPLSPRQRRWDNAHFHAYGYGWRLSDVNGLLKVAHTGTLAGMYSAVTLLPERRVGFVVLINGDGADARTALEQVLVSHFSAPDAGRPFAWYAEELARMRQARAAPAARADPVVRRPASLSQVAPWVGVYRDAWFGEVAVCLAGERVRFTAVKSPKLTGDVMASDGDLLVDWDDASVDAEPWLIFTAGPPGVGAPTTLTLAKVDPDADASYDFEDLFFTRIADCSAASQAVESVRAAGESAER